MYCYITLIGKWFNYFKTVRLAAEVIKYDERYANGKRYK